MHGVYKPGNVKLRPEVLAEGQKVAAAKLGLPDGAKPFDFVFHGGSGSLKSEIEEALHYGVVKMNVDTDTQYAFTRPIAGHMFTNYDGVLKVDGEVGSKKVYDPRSYLKKAEAEDDRARRRGLQRPAQRGPVGYRELRLHEFGAASYVRPTSSCCWSDLADLPLVVAELQVEAAGGPGLRRVGHERGDIGLGVFAVDDDLVDAGDHRILLGGRDTVVRVGPILVVVVDVVVPDSCRR